MATSGYCDSWVSTYSTGTGAFYRWYWEANQSTPGKTVINWTLQGRGRTSSPTWLLNECHITVGGGVGTIYSMEWGVNQNTGDGTNTSFDQNTNKSWRGNGGSFTITHTNASAVSLTVDIYASFWAGDNTGQNKSSTITIDANPPQYTISYNANGGSGTMASGKKTYGIDYTIASNGFTKPANTSTNYTITLNGNGGTTPTPKTCTRTTSYSFANWTLNSTSGTAYAAGAKYTTNAAATFYAKWSGSASGTVVLGSTTRSNSTANGFKVTFNPNNGTTTKTDQTATNTTSYSFKGWGTTASATTVAYNSTTAYGFSANTTLYAMWNSSTANGAVILPTAAQCTRTGYTLAGWATSSSATTAVYSPGASYTPTAATTLYAVWTANTYTVVYNGNGATGGSTATTNHTYGVSATLSTNGFSKTGHVFKQWNTRADGTGTSYTSGQSVSNLTSTNNGTVTLYAIWTAWTYTVTYYPNGGEGASYTSSHTYGKSSILTPNRFTREDYTFLGWSTTITGSVIYSDGATAPYQLITSNGQNIDLYAQWDQNSPWKLCQVKLCYNGKWYTC